MIVRRAVAHRLVRTGKWLYDGTVLVPVYVVELDFDYWYESAKSSGALGEGEVPHLNADGVQFYVMFETPRANAAVSVRSEGFDTSLEAAHWAQSVVPTPISWA